MSLAQAGATLKAALTGRRPRIISVEVNPDPSGWAAWWNADLGPGSPAMLCLPPEGRRIWGRGVARALRPPVHDGALAALWADLEPAGDPSPPPSLFAALPFDHSAPWGEPWTAFGGGELLLPRWAWEDHGGRAWVRLIVDDPEAEAETALAEWQRLCAARQPIARPPAQAPMADTVAEGEWESQISEVLRRISRGLLQKVVLAREATYTLPAPIPVTTALARLKASQPGCMVFGIRKGGATFLGATPERLIRRTGRVVETDALAGTGQEPEALLQSAKDRWEHQLVVDAISSTLGPRCASLDWRTPEVVRLRDLCHLRTRFRGELRGQDSALALAQALHPTPAVGGVPRAAALELIGALERTPRGLYAGPVGWVDQLGDGALWVALRSGVVSGRHLSLFAGVGVVAGSQASAELVETARKLRAMEAAFSP